MQPPLSRRVKPPTTWLEGGLLAHTTYPIF